MELRHLRYFVAVAEELSFTRAAKRLHISQSPLSRRIQDLEADVGALLFDRSGSRLHLTAAGRDFLAKAHSILEHVARAGESARALAAGHAGTVRVGYMAAALYNASALHMFRRFQHDFPKVQITFTSMTHGQQFEALGDGRIDLGLVYEGCVPANTLSRQTLVSGSLEFMFCKGHRLVQAPRLMLSDMASEPFIMPIREHVPGIYEPLLAAWTAHGFRPRIVMESDTYATTALLVASGAGVTFTGRASALRFAHHVDVRPAEDFTFRWGAELVWMPDRNLAVLEHLRSYLREEAGDAFLI